MFWQAEDVQPAVKVVAEVFGKVGNMETGKNVLYNVSIFSRQYGKLWYGDLVNDGISEKLTSLSTKLGMSLSVIDDNFETVSIN
jgi:hypothetical protein